MSPWWNPFKRTPEPAPVLQTPTLAALEPPKPLPGQAPRGGIVASKIPHGDVAMHPGWGLTAGRIRAAFMAAERGYPADQCDIFDDVIERDGHLRSLVEGHIEAVAGKQWIVQAGGDEQADVEAALALENALRKIPNVGQTWEHLLTADLYGYAATEMEWQLVDGVTVPVWFGNVPHRRFKFTSGTDEPRLLTKEETVDGLALERGKWIFATRRHRHTVRAGLLRTATWWAWLKGLSVRDWQIFCSRFGLPFIIAQYSKDATEPQIEAVKAAILAFGQQGGAALEEGTVFDIKEPPSFSGGGAQVHPGLVDLCNSEMSKLVSGATLTSGEGTSAGSYALGKVHQDRAFDRTLGAAERLANWFQIDVGMPFVTFNGMKARPPRLKVRVVREVDPTSRMDIICKAVNELRMTIDADQIRTEFDLKAPAGSGGEVGPAPEPEPAAPAKAGDE